MTTKTYTVPSPNDVEYWANHNKPYAHQYPELWGNGYYTIEPTFIRREWDRSKWHYIHPVTNEILSSVYTYY